ncbi:hypothetical protein [Paenibacillus dendritiformis]|uniref:hypothetical protein n=1 Tax=Paenibacillus dendritiformis TaxID=130049 RepID=UPI0011B7E921|nr:hypothetical protein [Paenibacillus dendritiformis]
MSRRDTQSADERVRGEAARGTEFSLALLLDPQQSPAKLPVFLLPKRGGRGGLIVYRDYFEQWLQPLAESAGLPLEPLPLEASGEGQAPDGARLLYRVSVPYADRSQRHRDTTGPLTRLVEMEWQLVWCSPDPWTAMEHCRQAIGWLWTEGVDKLEGLSAALVHVSDAQWVAEPVHGLEIRVRLRMRDSFARTSPGHIEKVHMTLKEMKE